MTAYRAQTMRARSGAIAALDALWRQQPVLATSIGIHRFDDKLAAFSPSARAAQSVEIGALLERVRGVNAEILIPDDRANQSAILADLAVRRLRLNQTREWERDPLLYAEECIRGLYLLTIRSEPAAKKRYASARARAREVPRVLAEMRANLTVPDPALSEAAAEALTRAADDLPRWMSDLATRAGKKTARDADAATTAAVTAMRAAAADLRSRPVVRDSSPGMGREAFDAFLQAAVHVDCDSDSILRLANRVLRDARASLADSAWYDAVATPAPPSFGRSSVLAAYRGAVDTLARVLSGARLVTIPRSMGDVTLAEIPPALAPFTCPPQLDPVAPFDFPNPGEHNVPDERRRAVSSAILYVDPIPAELSDAERQRWYIEARTERLAASAAAASCPGRHLQTTIAAHLIDPVRNGVRSLSSSEGWAAYCETLILHQNLALDTGVRLAILARRHVRACRAVADLRLQRREWTIERAARFLSDETGVSPATATRLAVCDAHSPGRAAAALAGEAQILALRDRYRRARRADYSLRAFHDGFLRCGMIPVPACTELLAGGDAGGHNMEGESPHRSSR
jgi:hypothetical protein